jgi:hypothetical protein
MCIWLPQCLTSLSLVVYVTILCPSTSIMIRNSGTYYKCSRPLVVLYILRKFGFCGSYYHMYNVLCNLNTIMTNTDCKANTIQRSSHLPTLITMEGERTWPVKWVGKLHQWVRLGLIKIWWVPARSQIVWIVRICSRRPWVSELWMTRHLPVVQYCELCVFAKCLFIAQIVRDSFDEELAALSLLIWFMSKSLMCAILNGVNVYVYAVLRQYARGYAKISVSILAPGVTWRNNEIMSGISRTGNNGNMPAHGAKCLGFEYGHI